MRPERGGARFPCESSARSTKASQGGTLVATGAGRHIDPMLRESLLLENCSCQFFLPSLGEDKFFRTCPREVGLRMSQQSSTPSVAMRQVGPSHLTPSSLGLHPAPDLRSCSCTCRRVRSEAAWGEKCELYLPPDIARNPTRMAEIRPKCDRRGLPVLLRSESFGVMHSRASDITQHCEDAVDGSEEFSQAIEHPELGVQAASPLLRCSSAPAPCLVWATSHARLDRIC